MIEWSVALVFAGACLVLTLTPGPDMILIASRSLSQSKASGFCTLAGIQVGTYCHALAAALGLSQLLVSAPAAYDAVRFLGAAYLAFLAWKAFRSPGAALEARQGLASDSMWRIFRQGLTTNLLNPKMALFVLALFPQFVRPSSGSVVAQMLVLATILNAMGLLVNGAVIVLVSKLGRRLATSAQTGERLNRVLGTVYFGLACRLAWPSGR